MKDALKGLGVMTRSSGEFHSQKCLFSDGMKVVQQSEKCIEKKGDFCRKIT